jgi:hypothetical protein
MTKREETEQRVVEMAEELKEMHKEKINLSIVCGHECWLLEYTPAKTIHPKFP